MKKTEIIVIGSGPGGSLSATLLAEAGFDVTLIEKGKYLRLSDVASFSSEEMNKKYANGGITLAFGKTKINYVEGACVGGGSEVNSGLYHRLPESILTQWEKENALSFDQKLIEEYYQNIEKEISISLLPGEPSKTSLKLKDGAKKLNWNCAEIPRWYKYNEDSSKGVKQSMTETYIPRFLDAGGTLLTETEVKKIKKETVDGVILECIEKEQRVYDIKADYIFLCAGAIHSPFLLLKSGYKHNVGKSLKMHPSFKFSALFDEKINNENAEVSTYQVKEFSPEISFGCSISTPSYISLILNDTNNMKYLSQWEKMAIYYMMIMPEGMGTISKIPFFSSPFIRYKLTPKDYQNIQEGYKKLATLLFEAGAKKLFPSVKKNIVIENLKDLEKIDSLDKSLLNLMTIHLFSSLKMGGIKKNSAVDPNGKLWKSNRIFACDGSVLCDAPSVNPQGTIMMMTTYVINKFIADHK